MIYFLDNGDIISLSVDKGYVAFMILSEVTGKPIMSSVRFKPVSLFSPKHMTMIMKLMDSPNQGDKNIGLAILQQTLKVQIHGELIG